MEKERKLEILAESSLSDFLDEIVDSDYEINLPSGLKVHCPDNYDAGSVAEDLKKMIDSDVSAVIDEIKESLEEGNELDGTADMWYRVEGNDIIFELGFGPFEEYGRNVDLLDDIFVLGNVVSEVLKKVSDKDGKYFGMKYEGIISWTLYWGQAYVNYELLCNMSSNEYAKEVVLNDEEFWDDYEGYFE